MKPQKPLFIERGQVWLTLLKPTIGSEINTKDRPCIVVSNDTLNKGQSGLVTIIPVTGTDWQNPLHIEIIPPEGGLTKTSFAVCEQVRTLSVIRFGEFFGTVSEVTLNNISDRLSIILGIGPSFGG